MFKIYGTIGKAMSQGTCMPNMKAIPLSTSERSCHKDRRMDRQTEGWLLKDTRLVAGPNQYLQVSSYNWRYYTIIYLYRGKYDGLAPQEKQYSPSLKGEVNIASQGEFFKSRSKVSVTMTLTFKLFTPNYIGVFLSLSYICVWSM